MPPRKRAPAGPTPVEAIEHRDKRLNVPAADAAEAYEYEPDVRQASYARDPSLDPQLVWRGKADADLVADAPPIYIQEKIDPRVLINDLRASRGGDQLDLFATFDGLDELDIVDFYRHHANWSNRMILGDSLQVMASLAEREELRGQVQMIYLDPPYGIKFGSNWQSRVGKRDVKDGKLEDAAREAEQIKAFRDTWELGIHSYLSYLRDRLVAARDLLTESGSCFVQIGDENVHLVRALMDEVFGSENFVTTVVVRKKSATTPTDPVNDYVLWIARDREALKVRVSYDERREPEDDTKFNTLIGPSGDHKRVARLADDQVAALLASGYRWARVNYPVVSQHPDPERSRPFEWNGKTFTCGRDQQWRFGAPGQMERLAQARRLFDGGGQSLGGIVYWEDWPYTARSNLWLDFHGDPERWYVVQTNRKIAERCMLMCTDPGDLVLDPTCGSGTTAYVAEQWGRRWITIDTSRVALALARQRLMGARFPYYTMSDPSDIRHGFDYERVQHITLKSIANNPDIHEGMSRAEIDAAIKRHAEFETLYDKPKVDNTRVRVTGPFTVESLSPHRSLAFASMSTGESISEQLGAEDAEGPNFEQSILDNLAKAGIQNGRRNERISFANLDSYAGVYVQAVGEQADAADEAPTRVGIAIGPQYGTVSASFIKSAAKESIAAGDIDLLCVLGFAFDAQATEVTEVEGVNIKATDEGFANVADERRLGRLKVLLVRMNVDLLMGEDLKKTGAGNLFTVFGEPDIDVRDADGQVVVQINGVDVYDPTTGAVRSDDTSQIALWMIDTNYNDEAFFVRQCYFTGGGDPYKRLKTALRAEIDPDAWSSLYRTESRPFARPATGKIAVKVINDYGDEVMKVFDV